MHFMFIRRNCLLVLLGLVMSSPVPLLSAEPDKSAVVSMDSQGIDAGIVFPMTTLDLEGRLINTTPHAVKVVRIAPRVDASRDVVSFTPTPLEPGDSMRLGLKVDVGEYAGRFSRVFFAFSDTQAEPVAKVVVRGFVDWMIDPESTRFDAGIVKAGDEVRHKFSPSMRPGVDLRLVEVERGSGAFDARIGADGRTVEVFSKRKLPWGPFVESVVVRTNDKSQPRVLFKVFGSVRGPVVPSQESVEFGLIREGQEVEQLIRLSDTNGKALRVGEVIVTGADARAQIEPCIPESETCRLVRLLMTGPEIGTSRLAGQVKIAIPEYGEILPIAFSGALIGKDTVIQDTAKAMEEARSAPVSLATALRAATIDRRPVETPVPDGEGPLLMWETSDESQVYGYEIYRATSKDGKFERVNEGIIKKLSKDPAIGSIYRWRDRKVVPGEYWYYIGIVHLDGTKKNLNEPSKVTYTRVGNPQ